MDSSRPVVWITGAGGLIGHHLAGQAPAALAGYRIMPLGRPDLDLADPVAVEARFRTDRPELILHCAALSRSPACEADPRLARRLNVEMTRHLVGLDAGVRLVFFSSDLVFGGRAGGYTEADSPNPLMVYGETKAEAEAVVLENAGNLVVRTSLNAGHSPTGDRGVDEQLYAAWRDGRTARLFSDEIRTPIPATETARAVLDLVRAGARGVIHVSGGERLSRWELGVLLAARNPDLKPRIERTSIHDQPGMKRPSDVGLDCGKAEALLGRPMPRFSDWTG